MSWGGFAVAAALLAFMLVQEGASTPSAAPEDGSGQLATAVELSSLPMDQNPGETSPVYRVSALRRGAVIQASKKEVRFRLRGIADWTLTAGSLAVVRSTVVPHEVELVSGRIDVEVVPDRSSDKLNERVMIVAGRSRISVHGTVFSVTRDDEQVVVDVMRGVVAVSDAVYQGQASGRLVVGPQRATFSPKDGSFQSSEPMPAVDKDAKSATASEAKTAERPESGEGHAGQPADPLANEKKSVSAAAHPAPANKDAVSSESTAADAANKDEAPSTDGTENVPKEEEAPKKLSIDQARAMVLGCLYAGRDKDNPADLRVTVSSRVDLKLDTAGKVSAVRFTPPLKPELQQRCGGALFAQHIDGAGSASFNIRFAPR